MKYADNNWKRKAVLFLISQCITLLGTQIVQMAIVWYVTLQTDSGAWVALFSVCSYLPQFFFSFLGGVWADRYHKKRLIIGADMFIAVITVLMIVFMPGIKTASAWMAALLFMSILRSVGSGIQSPAVNAVIPDMVPEQQLMRYNGINAAMQAAVQLAAPAAASAVLTVGSLRAVLMIDVVTAVIGVGLFLTVPLSKREKVQRAEKTVFADIRNGMEYVCSDKTVGKTLTIYGLFVFLTVPAGYLSGLLVSRIYGDTYWYLTAVELAGFGGMLAGGLLMSVLGRWKNRRFLLFSGLILFGTMAVGMSMAGNFLLYLIFMTVYGIALTAVQTTITTILQEHTASFMQGRVFGLMSSLYSSCYPIGMVIFGPLADVIPLQKIMAASGILLIAGAGFSVIRRT